MALSPGLPLLLLLLHVASSSSSMVSLVQTHQTVATPPPSPCPPNCPLTTNGGHKGCGESVKYANGSVTFECPKTLLFSVGFDSNMVLQRDATTAIYGQMIGNGGGAQIEVTVRESGGGFYTVKALVVAQQSPTYSVMCWHPQGDPPCYVANYTASWKAFLKPATAGGDYTISAKCTAGCSGDIVRDTSTIERVTMGDVYFCSGQSNMQLPNTHSYSAKSLQKQLQSGKYPNLRWFQMIGGHEYEEVGKQGAYTPIWTRQTGVPSAYPYEAADGVMRQQTWWNASYGGHYPRRCQNPSKEGNDTNTCKFLDWGPFFGFSAACTEFARNLIDTLGEDAPPIGLLQSAVGGTTIEAWSPNATTTECQNKTVGGPTAAAPDGRLYYGMVAPFVNTTVAGWLWYQGENNMHGSPGSSLSNEGYGCMMAGMVAAWRKIWSAVPNTTDPLAPFGVVTIAPSGSEGADYHLSAFRWAQTANYGVLPNDRMPNTYVAQAYDLDDPWAYLQGADSVCSDNSSLPNSCTWTNNGTSPPPPCCQCGEAMASPQCVWDPNQWNPALRTVHIFRQKSTLEDAIGSHTCSLEVNMRVTNGIPLGCSLLLPVTLYNFRSNTVKARWRRSHGTLLPRRSSWGASIRG
jgi:hypothetical protein